MIRVRLLELRQHGLYNIGLCSVTGLFLGRFLRRNAAHVHSPVQHVVDALHRLVLGVYFPQRVAHDAQVAPEFRDQRHDFVRVAQYFHALRVRIVPDAERLLNAVGEFSEIQKKQKS